MYVAGDLAGWTAYTTRKGKVVWFPKSPPTKPPSPGQIRQRARFAFAQQLWSGETSQAKAAWEAAVMSANLDMTGQNAYISQSLLPDPTSLATLNSRTGSSLTMPFPTPG